MDENQVGSAVQQAAGKVQGAAGELLGDTKTQAEGAAREIAGEGSGGVRPSQGSGPQRRVAGRARHGPAASHRPARSWRYRLCAGRAHCPTLNGPEEQSWRPNPRRQHRRPAKKPKARARRMRCSSRCSHRRSWPQWSARTAAPGRGGEQGLGLHQGPQPAEPGEPPRDPGRRQAQEVFGKDKVTMFEMNKHLAQHLK